MNKIKHLDNGFVLLKEDSSMASPIAVLYYQNYKNIEDVNNYLSVNKENIQCIVSDDNNVKNAIGFGKAQYPELWDYADNVDTMEFLLNI